MGLYSAKNSPCAICSLRAVSRILNYDQTGRIYTLPSRNGRRRGVRRVSVLSELGVGETGVILALELPESVQNHMMHMGFVPDALITAVRRAPAGDPTVYSIDGMEIALRHETASAIRVRQPEANEDRAADSMAAQSAELAEAAR